MNNSVHLQVLMLDVKFSYVLNIFGHIWMYL